MLMNSNGTVSYMLTTIPQIEDFTVYELPEFIVSEGVMDADGTVIESIIGCAIISLELLNFLSSKTAGGITL